MPATLIIISVLLGAEDAGAAPELTLESLAARVELSGIDTPYGATCAASTTASSST